MSDPYIGEIRPFALNYTPVGFLLCDGSKVAVNQYQALFAVIANLYGPTDYKTYFTLPNFTGLAPMHWGAPPQSGWPYSGPAIAQIYGAAAVTAQMSNFAPHTHQVQGAAAAATTPVDDSAQGEIPYRPFYTSTKTGYLAWSTAQPSSSVTMAANTVSVAGAPAPAAHENRQPFLVFRFCIASEGVFPVSN